MRYAFNASLALIYIIIFHRKITDFFIVIFLIMLYNKKNIVKKVTNTRRTSFTMASYSDKFKESKMVF